MKKISVIIPCYNEEKYITVILRNLLEQDFDMRLAEIIVVDNDSSDSTVCAVEGFMSSNPRLDIILISESNPGVSHARNTGARCASGEVLIFLDADNSLEKSFLKEIYRKFFIERYEAGTICTLALESRLGCITFLLLEQIKTILGRPFGKSFCSKEIFEAVGGFSVGVGMAGTNLDFLLRVKKLLKKRKRRKMLGHVKKPIYASLRRFEVDGYVAILSKWLLAYIGFKKVHYDRK